MLFLGLRIGKKYLFIIESVIVNLELVRIFWGCKVIISVLILEYWSRVYENLFLRLCLVLIRFFNCLNICIKRGCWN